MKRQHILLPVVVISLLLLQLTFAASPRYEVIDLGTLGGNQSVAQSINDEGQIVGWARKSVGFHYATLFDPTGGGKNLDLGTLGFVPPPSPLPFNRPYGGASSINDNGQIVGWAIHSSGSDRAAIFDATGYGNNIHLGTLSGYNYSWAASINGNGQIVGACAAVSRWFPTRNRATLFDPTGSGNNIDLGTLGGDQSYACGINNIGQIVGAAENSSGDPHATLFDSIRNGNNIDLAPLDIASGAYSINDNGQIVGEIFKSGYWHATLFDTTGNGNNIDLGTLGGDESCAISINQRGQIVGWSQKGTGILDSYATLFDPTGGGNNIDLNTLIDPACDLTLISAHSINDHGWIVGKGYYIYNGVPPFSGPHAYLLIPQPIIIYVDADATGANDGSSWADAFNYLQDALTAAWSGDEIWVAQGTYKPDQGATVTPGDRKATFQLISGVTLKGGYAGAGSPDPNARNIELYETILTGDLAGNDIDVNDPCDLLTEPTRAENSFHVLTGSGTDETAIFDGFTITGGNANGPTKLDDDGGGIWCYKASPTISNCVITKNSSTWLGGGMTNWSYSNPTVTNCLFSENEAGVSGGGMENYGHCSPMVKNCVFSQNSAGSGGGGMFNLASCSPTVINCVFSENKSTYSGGGMDNLGGSPTVTNCVFSENESESGNGGGMDNIGSSPTVTNCVFSKNKALSGDGGGMSNSWQSNPTLTNCTFAGNSAWAAGGLCNEYGSPTVRHCTFSGNWALLGGGMYNKQSSPIVNNCKFLGNVSGGMLNISSNPTVTDCKFIWNSWAGLETYQGNPMVRNCRFSGHKEAIFFDCCNESLTVTNCTLTGNERAIGLDCDAIATLSNCILWGNNVIISNYDGTLIINYSCVQRGWPGEGNIDAEPCFVQPGYWDANGVWVEGDYHLLPDSPCIDAGDPNYIAEPNETDLDGKPRVIGGRIDMGAYEYCPPVPAEVRIVPRTINLTSKGRWITCHISLPEGYNVADIDPNSILLEDEIRPASFRVDEEKQIAIVKFNRSGVQDILKMGEVELTIAGQLTDGTVFEGTDVIKVLNKAGKK